RMTHNRLDLYILTPSMSSTNQTRLNTESYTLSLHDALPISPPAGRRYPPPRSFARRPAADPSRSGLPSAGHCRAIAGWSVHWSRSEEHTSELQSRENLVCRLLLEKKQPVPNWYPVGRMIVAV